MIAKRTITLLLFFASTLLFALPGDDAQNIVLIAARAELNQQAGTATYWDNVHITQGSRHVWGDQAIFYQDEHGELTRAIVYGNLARFRYLPDINDPEVTGEALTIEYIAGTETLILEGDAWVEQDNNTYAAPRIEYDLVNDVITSKPTTQSRTQIVIHSNN